MRDVIGDQSEPMVQIGNLLARVPVRRGRQHGAKYTASLSKGGVMKKLMAESFKLKMQAFILLYCKRFSSVGKRRILLISDTF